jgi:hypothetical protein
MFAGKDWSAGRMKRNDGVALRKPEVLSRTRAQGMKKKAIEDYCVLYQNLCTELHIHEKPQLIFYVVETGFLHNSIPPSQIVATKGG